MLHRLTPRYLLAALAVAGLIFAPMARPPMAAPAAELSVTVDQEPMPENMPCCPDQPGGPSCAKGCPLTANCGASFAQSVVPDDGFLNPAILAGRGALPDDVYRDGLAQGPPPRPPKA